MVITRQIYVSNLNGKPCQIKIKWSSDFMPFPSDWSDLVSASINHLADGDRELRKYLRAALRDKHQLLFIYVVSTFNNYRQSRTQALLGRRNINDTAHVCTRTEGPSAYFQDLRRYKSIARFLQAAVYKFE